MMTGRERLRKNEILSKSREIETLFRQGKKIVGNSLVLQFLKLNGAERKVAFIISSKIKGAVKRNFIKRRLKEIYRRNKELFPRGYSYLLYAKENAKDWKNFSDLRASILQLLEKMPRTLSF